MDRWMMSNARGWFLDETQGSERGGGLLVGRAAFWQCLRRKVADSAILGHEKVVEVLPGDTKQGSECKIQFEDGGKIEADLVAGYDRL